MTLHTKCFIETHGWKYPDNVGYILQHIRQVDRCVCVFAYKKYQEKSIVYLRFFFKSSLSIFRKLTEALFPSACAGCRRSITICKYSREVPCKISP